MRKLLGVVLVVASASCSSEPPRAEPVEAGAVCEVDRASTPPEWLRMEDQGRLQRFALAAETPHAAAPHAATAEAAPPHPPTTAPHGGAITALAATEDGSIAVTADGMGGVRLWPALDGTCEPVVIAAHPPLALAVARTDGEVAIAGLDAAGQLEIVRTTAAGVPVGRAVVDSPRPYRTMRALPAAFLAVRDDQQIDRIDPRGAIVASLVPEPGVRVGAIAVRRGKAIAMLASPEGVHGRWLELADRLAWGGDTPRLPIDPALAELSPDLRHLTALHARLATAATIDLVTGRAYAIPWEHEEVPESMRPLGFPAANELAMTSTFDNGVVWWLGGTTLRGFATEGRGGVTGPSVAVDGRVITASRAILVLHTDKRTQYLGYRMRYLKGIRGTRDGWIVDGGSPTRMLALDARFHERRRFAAPPETSSLHLVDDHHAIAAIEADGGAARDLYAIDLAHPEAIQLAWRTTGAVAGYEPSTHLLAVNDDNEIQFARVDPRTGAIGEPVRFPVVGPAYTHLVYLLDPARSRGNVALVIDLDYTGHTTTVDEIRAVTGEVKLARSYDIETHGRNVTDEVLRRHGLTPDGRPSWRRSPDGKWTAHVEAGRMTLRRADGEVQWVVDAHGAFDVGWRPDGALAALGGGIAAVDVETGALGARRCGWDFGLVDDPEFDHGAGAALCEAP
ncbi:MAG TPA: hypothetical protein VHT91_29860 [Kofleriaceae bacterium]|jgi:hypothetical protein|nr:hypothetical protein [Kofleriaceae bacterium]